DGSGILSRLPPGFERSSMFRLRRRTRALSLVLALPLLPSCRRSEGPAVPPPPEPWNVILLSIDTLRPDRLGAYGSTHGNSPRLDAFAEKGVVFEQAIAQAPWTLPSHASLLASEYPSALDVGTFSDPRAVHANARLLG